MSTTDRNYACLAVSVLSNLNLVRVLLCVAALLGAFAQKFEYFFTPRDLFNGGADFGSLRRFSLAFSGMIESVGGFRLRYPLLPDSPRRRDG